MKAYILGIAILSFVSCDNHTEDTPTNGPTSTSDKSGNLLVYYYDVDKPTVLNINNIDYSSKIIDTYESSGYCSNSNYNQYKIQIKVGQKYILHASNSLVIWDLKDISIQNENDCKEINLNTSNITSAPKSGIGFTNNFESGMRSITVNVDGSLFGTLSETTTNPNAPGAMPSSIYKETNIGTHSYTGQSENGHTWAGSVITKNGSTTMIELIKYTALPISSSTSNIIFYSPSYNNIKVFMENTYIGTVLSTYETNTLDFCIRNWVVSIIKPLGNYNYTASAGGHNWSGIVNANLNSGCIVIQLK